MAGYTRQAAANIVTGSVIDADDFNDEYNQVQSAFNASTLATLTMALQVRAHLLRL